MNERAALDEMERKARLGLELESFKRGPIYAFLIGKADQAAQEAAGKLVDAEPYEWKTIQRLQNEIKRATDLHLWIEEAISQGQIAHANLGEAETA